MCNVYVLYLNSGGYRYFVGAGGSTGANGSAGAMAHAGSGKSLYQVS